MLGEHEKSRLRELAGRVAEIAALTIQKDRIKLWTAHNDLKTKQPVIFIDPENGWSECISADALLCESDLARTWEMFLLKQIYWFEVLKDDKVIEPFFDVPYSYSESGWGLKLKKEGGENGGAFIQKSAIQDYAEDLPKIRYPQITMNQAESDITLALAHELFDGTLTMRRKTTWWWSLGITNSLISLRGLEPFL